MANRLTLLLCLVAAPALASPPPLIRSSEDTASRICLEYKRPVKDLVLACQDALTEFAHTDFELSRLYDHLGDALEELDQPKQARAAFHDSIAAFASRDYPWRGLGWSFWNTSEYTKAATAFRTALDLNTHQESLAGLGSSLRHLDSRDNEVADLFARALLISPEYTWVMVEQGWMFFYRSELVDAASTFRAVLAIDPEYANAAYGLSRTLALDDALEGALAAINDAVLNDPQVATYVIQRAQVLRRLGRNNLALSEARRAMALAPENQDGFVEAARALRDLGRMPEGYNVLDKAIDQGVVSNFLYFTYANMRADEEGWKAALKLVDKALIYPDADERDHNLRAFLLLKLERPQEGLEASQTALALDPDNSTALVNVAYSELALGHTENAVTALLAANAAGSGAGEINDFIAYVLSQGRFLLAGRLRIEVGKQNLRAASRTP